MAADSDALQRRIAALETELAALTRIISATPIGGLAINAPGGVSISCGGAMAIQAGTTLALTAGSNLTAAAGGRIKLNGEPGDHARQPPVQPVRNCRNEPLQRQDALDRGPEGSLDRCRQQPVGRGRRTPRR